jgi:D-amino peptidase
MKILIAVDMEGISGVVNWDQVSPSHIEYARFRQIMTEDVNAAVRGAYQAGAELVIVTDGHHSGNNILVEKLDKRARLNSGNGSPLAMIQGVQDGVDGVLLVGYHARAGTPNAILDHTWSSARVANVWLNGKLVGETGLNAAVSGHYNTPVIMVSGDQSVCREALDLLGPIETAVVKQASGRMSAECLPPEVSQEKICDAASRAVLRLVNGEAPRPLKLPTPVVLAVEFLNSDMADKASLLPGSQRDGRRIEFTATDMPAAYSAFRVAVSLATPS